MASKGFSPLSHSNAIEDATEVPLHTPLELKIISKHLITLGVSWPEAFSDLLTASPDHRVSRNAEDECPRGTLNQ